MMVSHWSLSDNKSPQVSGTLLSILTVFNNAVVWNVSALPISITKVLLNGPVDLYVGGQLETIHTTALLRTARILRRVQETSEDLMSEKSAGDLRRLVVTQNPVKDQKINSQEII